MPNLDMNLSELIYCFISMLCGWNLRTVKVICQNRRYFMSDGIELVPARIRIKFFSYILIGVGWAAYYVYQLSIFFEKQDKETAELFVYVVWIITAVFIIKMVVHFFSEGSIELGLIILIVCGLFIFSIVDDQYDLTGWHTAKKKQHLRNSIKDTANEAISKGVLK